MFAEKPDIFLGDFGVPCSCGAYTFTGILNKPDEVLASAGANVLSTMYVLECKTADVLAAAIASGSSITVNAVAYQVRDVLSVDDGVFTNLALSK